MDIATLLALLAALLNTTIGVLLAVTAASSSLHVQPTLRRDRGGDLGTVRGGRRRLRAALPFRQAVGPNGAHERLSALALLTLFAPNALNLGVIVLLLATCVLVYRRPVGTWVRTLQGRTPA